MKSEVRKIPKSPFWWITTVFIILIFFVVLPLSYYQEKAWTASNGDLEKPFKFKILDKWESEKHGSKLFEVRCLYNSHTYEKIYVDDRTYRKNKTGGYVWFKMTRPWINRYDKINNYPETFNNLPTWPWSRLLLSLWIVWWIILLAYLEEHDRVVVGRLQGSIMVVALILQVIIIIVL